MAPPLFLPLLLLLLPVIQWSPAPPFVSSPSLFLSQAALHLDALIFGFSSSFRFMYYLPYFHIKKSLKSACVCEPKFETKKLCNILKNLWKRETDSSSSFWHLRVLRHPQTSDLFSKINRIIFFLSVYCCIFTPILPLLCTLWFNVKRRNEPLTIVITLLFVFPLTHSLFQRWESEPPLEVCFLSPLQLKGLCDYLC